MHLGDATSDAITSGLQAGLQTYQLLTAGNVNSDLVARGYPPMTQAQLQTYLATGTLPQESSDSTLWLLGIALVAFLLWERS